MKELKGEKMPTINPGANLDSVKRLCPKCGAPMKIRKALKGSHAGSFFWGCTNYPNCKTIEEITDDEINKINLSSIKLNAFKQNYAKIQEETPRKTRYFDGKSLIESYEAFFFESLSLPLQTLSDLDNKKLDYNVLLNASRFRVDYITKQYSIDSEEKAIFSLILRLLNRGKITLNSPFIEHKLIKLFNIDLNNDYKIDCLDNYINYKNVINNVDSQNEQFFIDNCLIPLFGSNWASHVLTQASLYSLTENSDVKGQRVDFLLSQNDKNFIIELDGKEHQYHKDKDTLRDDALKQSGYKVIRIPNSCLSDTLGNLNMLRECGFTVTTQREYNKQEKFLIASKIAHELEIAIVKGLETGYIKLEDNLSISLNSNYFNKIEIVKILEIVLKDIYDLVKHFGILYQIDIKLNLKHNLDNSICLSFGNKANAPKQIIIRDITIKDNILARIENFELITPKEVTEENLIYFLNYIYRFPHFQEGQYQAIERLISKKDSIILLPTGSGKSLIFQLSSFLVSGMTIVISPITSLMDDQVENLIAKGIDNALRIYSAFDKKKLSEQYELMNRNNFSLLYLSPERLQVTRFRELIHKMILTNSIYSVAIDEAHCVSEWGHDFRTAYLNIGKNTRRFFTKNDDIPVITALTGTASNAVLKDVQRELEITDINAIITPHTFDRNELNYHVYSSKSDYKDKTIGNLVNYNVADLFKETYDNFSQLNEENSYCGIIFCPHVNGKYGVTHLAGELMNNTTLKIGIYSGSCPTEFDDEDNWNKMKLEVARKFKHNELNLLVATKAFGMGIDKPNIRYTIHYGIPSSIESFYQEAGRAGRDHKKSKCLIVFSHENDEMTEVLLDPSTSLYEIKTLIDATAKDKKDDIIRMLYFHTQAFKGLSTEKDRIDTLINKLYEKEDSHIYLVADCDRNDFEKAIQRLLVLDIIEDYSVDYSSNEYDIEKKEIDKNKIIEAYLNYVRGYNQARVGTERRNVERFLSLDDFSFIKIMAKTLVEFIYDTIEKGRRRALKEMYDLASDALQVEHQDEFIRKRITDYFDSSYAIDLDYIVTSEKIIFKDIYAIFEGQIIDGENVDGVRSINDIETVKASVGRYLESTPDHPSLLMIRTICDCLLHSENEDNKEMMEDFQNALSFAQNRYSVDEKELISFITYFLSKVKKYKEISYDDIVKMSFKNIKNKNLLMASIINSEEIHYNDVDTPLLVYTLNSLEEIITKVKNKGK